MNKSILLSFLLSLATGAWAQTIPSEQNPKYNSNLNPRYNSDISPKYNSKINPRYNSDLNPRYNSDVNPKYNSDINPKYNSDVNPKYNSKLNPKYNWDLKPSKYTFKGKYLFDTDANVVGYILIANNDFYLLYNLEFEWEGYFVRAGSNFNLFDLDAVWTGQYLCSDSSLGYNLFGEDNEWTGNYIR